MIKKLLLASLTVMVASSAFAYDDGQHSHYATNKTVYGAERATSWNRKICLQKGFHLQPEAYFITLDGKVHEKYDGFNAEFFWINKDGTCGAKINGKIKNGSLVS